METKVGGFGRPDYWSLSYEERRGVRDHWEQEQSKPWNRLKNHIYYLRGRLSDFIAPEGWYDE